jgi:hypothetical protein
MRAHTTLVFGFWLVAACGARTPLDIDVGGDVSSPAPDAAVPDSSSSGTAKHVGYLGVVGSTPSGARAFAQFFPDPVDPTCAYLGEVGACSVARCPVNTSASADAGSIRASAANTRGSATLQYQGQSPSGSYATAPLFTNTTDLSPSTSVLFVGTGGADVPMMMTYISTPVVGQLASPDFAASPTIHTSDDLALSWSAIPYGDAVFTLSPPNASGDVPLLVCAFDGAATTGVVPRETLVSFKQILQGGNATASFVAMARSPWTLGEWTVNMLGMTSTAAGATGTVTLE